MPKKAPKTLPLAAGPRVALEIDASKVLPGDSVTVGGVTFTASIDTISPAMDPARWTKCKCCGNEKFDRCRVCGN